MSRILRGAFSRNAATRHVYCLDNQSDSKVYGAYLEPTGPMLAPWTLLSVHLSEGTVRKIWNILIR